MHNQRRATRWWIRAGAAAAALATILASAACSSSGGTAEHSDAASDVAASTGPAPDVVTILGTDYAYKITGSPHAGLVEIDFNNMGKYAHEVGLSRTKDGVTLDQMKTALNSDEAAARALLVDPDTEITSAATIAPNINEKAVVPLEAGHYIVTCFLPGPDGMPHTAMGMIGEFTVLDAAATAPAAPHADGTVNLTDDEITLPPGFSAGGTFEVMNTGTAVHDFSVAKLAGQPLEDYFQCVAQSFGAGTPIDQCPGALQGGVTALQPGESAYLTIAIGPGDYGYVSTQGEGADFQAGLNGTFSKS